MNNLKPVEKNTIYERKVPPYIITGYPVIDMVGACINHAERFYRKVRVITLAPKYWDRFMDSIKRIDETYADEKVEAIDFDGVIVSRGSRFQLKSLKYELVPIVDERKTKPEKLN